MARKQNNVNSRALSNEFPKTPMASAEDHVPISAPRGTDLNCENWQIEAPYRMLMNNLDSEVAEDPEHLVVYGGTGQAARNWECYENILTSLERMKADETLVVQSGKPIGVFPTREEAPRVLIANSLLVPDWANWEHFNELQKKGLMMYGQMTAGSWIYIGTQGILQGTYETFAAAARKHFDGSLEGKLLVTAGLGGMGGAQPLAATMNGAAFLGVEVNRKRMEKRVETGYLDVIEEDLDRALDRVREARDQGEALSVGLLGNAAEVLPELVQRDVVPDVLTDQTSAHDELNGYIPAGYTLEEAFELRKSDPDRYVEESFDSMARHVEAMLELHHRGAVTFDYGNNLRGQAKKAGVENAFDFPGFVDAYVRDLFCEGRGPFRWVALSGNPEDIYRTDRKVLELFPDDEPLHRWIKMAQDQVSFQGLPSRICWLGQGERERFGVEINRMVREGELEGPIVIGRDHLDTGSVASPNRETEGMKDGSDAVADWPVLNALLNTASGATWVSVHHGGGVGMGLSIHAGQVVCADGSDLAEERVRTVLHNDPGIGVLRHADAGYELAEETAKKHHLGLPDEDS